MLEAKRIRDYNKMIEQGITSNLLELRALEIQQTLADNLKDNANVIYMPLPLMENTNHMRTFK